MNPLVSNILTRHDRGEPVAAISAAEQVGFGYVYGVLREHRPDRARQPRTRTSEKRKLILGLLRQDVPPMRVAFLAKCTRAYIYKLMQEEGIAA